MDKIAKALKKLTLSERKKIKEILREIKNHRFRGLSIKKLKGREDIFRVRKGRIRIIYRMDSSGTILILTIERRSDKTYK